jgi:hypothetical protein
MKFQFFSHRCYLREPHLCYAILISNSFLIFQLLTWAKTDSLAPVAWLFVVISSLLIIWSIILSKNRDVSSGAG